jgi:hypothetical protein
MKFELIQKYRESAILHGEGTLSGDSGKTNLAYDELMKIYQKLKKDNLLSELKVLTKDSNSSVRVWSATHLLPLFEKESINVLDEVSKEKSLIGFTASMSLKEWRTGRLKL